MKQMFVLFSVAVLALTITMTGCKKGEEKTDTADKGKTSADAGKTNADAGKTEGAKDDKSGDALKSLSKDFCDPSKTLDFINGVTEFMTRTMYNPASGKTVEELVEMGKKSIKPEDVAFDTCKAEDAQQIKCDEAFTKIGAGMAPTEKMKAAAKDMGLSDTECASMKAEIKSKTDAAAKPGVLLFAKGKDKWVLIGIESEAASAPAASQPAAPADETAPAGGEAQPQQ